MSQIWNGLQEILGGTLSFFYGLIPNFGIAIILLTVTIGLLLFRLTLKQTRSMRAMQEIQPEIKKLQRDLKHDKQAQQQAMMDLYKERGINPAAGCLPLILQMPIWFALFSVLRSFGSAELTDRLRWVTSGSKLETAMNSGQTLDFLWMDLTRTPSAVGLGETVDGVQIAGSLVEAIPYFITILVVVATAWYQQRQTMARSNNQGQQQPGQAVMKIFPLFFGFISFNMPAGLVVYFAASQIFRIGQQALIISLDEKHAETAAAEAKEAKKSKPQPTPESDQGEGPTPSQGPKRRPQGSKKKRGNKRRRR
jgi:YidC/Oxa1 family membrane protein insertase